MLLQFNIVIFAYVVLAQLFEGNTKWQFEWSTRFDQ